MTNMKLTLRIFIFTLVYPFVVSAQNNAISFDGAASYLAIPSTVLTSGAANFTIEFWTKPNLSNNDGNFHGMIGAQQTLTGKRSPGIWYFTNGAVHLDTYAYTTEVRYNYESGAGFFVPGEWTHVAWVKNGTSYKVYRNGIETINFTAPAQVNVPANYTLGKIDNLFNGLMDEVRIWSVARTGAEIRKNMYNQNLSNSSPGLEVYYRFNEGAGTSAASSSTNTSGMTATLTSGPTWTASPVQWNASAVNFDGTNDYINMPAGVYFSDNTFTIETWVYVRSYQNYSRILDFGNGNGTTGNNNVVFVLSEGTTGTPSFQVYNGASGQSVVSSATIPLNTWTHVAAVLNGTLAKIYINGVERASGTFATAPANVSRAYCYIGRSGWSADSYANMMMDEFRIWSVARTQSEISGNMNKQLDPSTAGLTTYFSFDKGIVNGNNAGLTNAEDLTGNVNGTFTNMALSGASSNLARQYASLSSLPVEWLSFTARPSGKDVQLQWSLAAEADCRNFTAEHSLNGSTWTTLGVVPAINNSTGINTYSFTHNFVSAGRHYYRIALNGMDGKTQYSAVRNVLFDQRTGNVQFPGIAVGGKFQVVAESPAAFALLNSAGKVVYTLNLQPGTNNANCSFLPAGIYYIQVGNQSGKILITYK